ncbi:hypothetical protein [Ectothiorhodospira variabilis]|uniref:hypothetical protein n=1 Tax=Ectothiorhodospira variabilis TaxID=505694 RepID=UPI001EFB643E|nr:hypothetical protein [Ectothiorhodospira variabilis]MCG5495554.1 hypothetical protein [Ectothiorhodospira variabilis]MCG5505162.1 hypothetical protein [Ectothiorhodospira variabilis]MCG5508319.1 hypothetical protein [Ectothiorhodospira variabilis]
MKDSAPVGTVEKVAALSLFSVVAIGLLGAAVYAMFSVLSSQLAVVNEQEVGEVINATFDRDNSNKTSSAIVETTEGIFVVDGAFQLIKGNELTIRTRGSGSRYLCDPAQDYCARLR